MKKGKKRGPKTDNAKRYRIAVKLDQEAKDILDAFCEQSKYRQWKPLEEGLNG